MTSWGHWSPAVWLVLDALATYRLIRLVQRDTITSRPRAWAHKRYSGGWLLELVTCPWCLSIWVGAGVTLLTYFVPFAWSLVVTALVFSAVTGWFSDREH